MQLFVARKELDRNFYCKNGPFFVCCSCVDQCVFLVSSSSVIKPCLNTELCMTYICHVLGLKLAFD